MTNPSVCQGRSATLVIKSIFIQADRNNLWLIRSVIWLHGDALTVEYEETPLAQYTVRYQPDKKHFKDVPEAKRFETPYRSPQGWLWELDDTMWKLAKRLPDYAPRKRRKKTTLLQLSLLEEPSATQA